MERSPEDLQKQAEMLMKAIRKNIEGQMVYKNGMKRECLLQLLSYRLTLASNSCPAVLGHPGSILAEHPSQ